MKHLHMFIAGVCCCGFSMPSYAQSSDFERAFKDNAMEARVGITIPFGEDNRKAQSKPQFALGLRQETSRPGAHDWAMRPSFEETNARELKLSLTLEAAPTLLMNDQVLNFEKDASSSGTVNALDKYDKTVLTVIGASLVVIAGSIIILSDN